MRRSIEDVEKKYAYTDKAGKVSIVFLPLFDEEKNKDKTTLGIGGANRNNNSNYINPTNAKAEGNITAFKDTYQQQQNQNQNEQIRRQNNQNDGNDDAVRLPSLYVDCDSQKISQVIFNLLDNAMKFTFEGKVFVSTAIINNKYSRSSSSPSVSNDHHHVRSLTTYTNASDTADVGYTDRNRKTNVNDTINTYEQISRILVTVQDTGVGISPQIKDQLFEKFATKSRQGTGLGLYLSKKIIESHGGNIWYEGPSDEDDNEIDVSNTGNNKKIGTIFKFVIPISIRKKNKIIENRK